MCSDEKYNIVSNAYDVAFKNLSFFFFLSSYMYREIKVKEGLRN